MTKAISSYPEDQRAAVIQRRLRTKTNGAGYMAALKAAETLGIPIPSDHKAPRPRAEREKREKQKMRRRPLHQNKPRMAK